MGITSANIEQEKRLNRWAWLLSILVFILVLVMRRFKIETEINFSFLPAAYSVLNGFTSVFLVLGFYFIRVQKDRTRHEQFMFVSMLSSALFLMLYVLYHVTTPETAYCGVGAMRMVYFTLLISHIFLAAIILPFILFTYIRAYTKQFARHKRMARWVWPFWLYVAVSGPIIYLMLRPCY